MHYLDPDQLRRDPAPLMRLIADGHVLRVGDQRLDAVVEQIRVYPALRQPPFARLDEARQAFRDTAELYPTGEPGGYIGDTVVDALLRYRYDGPIERYSFASSLLPGLEGEDQTANLLLDYAGGDTRVFRQRGLLQTPIEVSRSTLAAAYTFIVSGIKHILAGFDHVLFVLCLTLGARRLGDLCWRVTGFTVGHTVTLIGGFLGYTPSAPWFIPAVETAIALSIIYAAAGAFAERSGRRELALTPAIGLLHGLGFAFVLQKMLSPDAPQLWQSLLAFNVGVELGQLAIVLLVWPAFLWLGRLSQRAADDGRQALALGCIVLAGYWTGERAIATLRALVI